MMSGLIHRTGILTCLTGVLLACLTTASPGQDQGEPPFQFWKGNIHTHSLWSDGNDFPEMIADWYRSRGYNFLALSDHNILSEGDRWMKVAAIEKRGGTKALAKYRQRFGAGWVETRGTLRDGDYEVRLKPLDEFRNLVEERQSFLMIPGEEISDSAEGKPVHMNATNLKTLIQPAGGATVREAMANNLKRVDEQAKKEKREILLHLNHPNFGWAVTAEDLAIVTQERFFEVYNGHPAVGHLGDEDHPSVERQWDIINTLRIAQLNAPLMLGVATDDSHYYHGRAGSRPGRGWIMVRARYLSPEHLIRAIKAGQFYGSSGVSLSTLPDKVQDGRLSFKIQAEPDVEYTTRFIGTRVGYDEHSQPRLDEDGKPTKATRIYSDEVGLVLATVTGPNPEYTLAGDEWFVRAVVTSNRAHPDPSFKDQYEQAWTQPIRLKPPPR